MKGRVAFNISFEESSYVMPIYKRSNEMKVRVWVYENIVQVCLA